MTYFYVHFLDGNFHTPCYYKSMGKDRGREGFEGAEGNGVYLVKIVKPQKMVKYPASPRISVISPTISPHTYGFDLKYDLDAQNVSINMWGLDAQMLRALD